MRDKTLFDWRTMFPRSPEPDPKRLQKAQVAKTAATGPREADEDDEQEVPMPVTEEEIKRNAKFQAMLKLQVDAEDKDEKKKAKKEAKKSGKKAEESGSDAEEKKKDKKKQKRERGEGR